MKFLQIWLGGPIPPVRIDCMKSVMGVMNDTDEYVFIGKNHFSKRVKPVNLADILMEADKKIVEEYNKTNEKHLKCDILRFLYMSKEKDVLYADTDVRFNRCPIVTKISFAEYGKYLIDYCVMYNGNSTDIFIKILNNAISSDCRSRKWIFGLLQEYRFKFDKITGFEHLRMHGKNG